MALLTFLQFLNESSAEFRIHHGITVPHLIALTHNSKGTNSTANEPEMQQTRFVIDKNDRLHAGDARFNIHDDLCPSHDHQYCGYITKRHNQDHLTYAIYRTDINRRDIANKKIKHPIIDKLKAAGVKRRQEPIW